MGRRLSWRVVLAGLLGAACGAAAALWLAGVFRDQSGDGMAKKKASKVYVVQQIYWQYVDNSEPLRESEVGGAGFPQKVFSDRASAEAHCRALNVAAREESGNPFSHGRGWGRSYPDLADYTSTPTGEFIDWLRAEGLKPPAGQRTTWQAWEAKKHIYPWEYDQDSYLAWSGWWQDNASGWSAEQRGRVWDKLDRVRFFQVFEVEADL